MESQDPNTNCQCLCAEETKKNPAQIWYVEGHTEILAHEMFHCEGPLPEGELMIAGRAVSAELQDPYPFYD